ncbi:MAG: hypothetical protein ACPGJV_09980 [Bacteriovoracaceae bacterium]
MTKKNYATAAHCFTSIIIDAFLEYEHEGKIKRSWKNVEKKRKRIDEYFLKLLYDNELEFSIYQGNDLVLNGQVPSGFKNVYDFDDENDKKFFNEVSGVAGDQEASAPSLHKVEYWKFKPVRLYSASDN